MVLATFRAKNQSRLALSLGSALLVGLISLGCDRAWLWTAPPAATQPAQAAPSSWTQQPTVHAQGTLLPAGGVLRMMGTPGDRIEQVLVKPDQSVKEGEQLVRLASERARQEELQLLDKRIGEAQQTWDVQIAEAEETTGQARRALRQAELAQRHAAEQVEFVRQAQRTVEIARRPLQRLEQAAQETGTSGLVSPADLDRQRLAVEQAEQQWRQSSLVAAQAQEAAEMAVEAAQRQVDAAQQMRALLDQTRPLDVLRQQRVLLETQSEIARIVAPINGIVLRVEANPGDSVGQLPLIEMADLSEVNCYAEVHEADAPRLQLGQVAQMQSAALQQPLAGRVQRIDSVVGRPQLRSSNPLAPVDFRAIAVTIALDPQSAALAARWIQLQVDVTIQTPPRQPQGAGESAAEDADELSGQLPAEPSTPAEEPEPAESSAPAEPAEPREAAS